MPPIAVKPLFNFEPDRQYGTHFGIFATEDMAENVLIGEYACDVMQSRDLILCKKMDSVMKYTNTDHYLAPRDFCGYVLLINSSKKTNNCNSITAIVNNFLRVLIYTNRKIKKGEELCYSYGS